jgi:hypothetical protein
MLLRLHAAGDVDDARAAPAGVPGRSWRSASVWAQRALLTRRITDLLTDAGFTITDVDVFYEKGASKLLAAESLGVAVAP